MLVPFLARVMTPHLTLISGMLSSWIEIGAVQPTSVSARISFLCSSSIKLAYLSTFIAEWFGINLGLIPQPSNILFFIALCAIRYFLPCCLIIKMWYSSRRVVVYQLKLK